MKKINAIIAGMPLNEKYVETTSKCIRQFRPLVDKITFIQNGKTPYSYPQDVLDLVDIFILNKSNRLHGGAINQGVLISQSYEFLAILNDDITPRNLSREGMEEMCVPGAMVSPQLFNGEYPQMQSYNAHASFWITDKETFLKAGLWDLTLKHQADVKHFESALSLGIPMMKNDKYSVNHDHPGQTINSNLFDTPEFTSEEI